MEENNNNSYSEPKNNNGIKALLVIIILLLVAVIGLTCYKLFVYDKKDDNKKDNNVVETGNNNANEQQNNSKIILDVDGGLYKNAAYFTRLGKGYDSIKNIEVLKNQSNKSVKERIKTQVLLLPYTGVAKKEYTNNEMFAKVAVPQALHLIGGKKMSQEYIDSTGDNITILTQAFDLTKEEISKMNRDLWESSLGGCWGCQEIYKNTDFNDVNTKIKELYKGYEYKLEEFETLSSWVYIIYDKNINAFVKNSGGGATGPLYSTSLDVIIGDSTLNDVYKVKYIGTYYMYDINPDEEPNYCYVVDKNNSNKKIDCFDNLEDKASLMKAIYDYTLEHKDELPQYEVSFKINGNNYSFVDIKKVN